MDVSDVLDAYELGSGLHSVRNTIHQQTKWTAVKGMQVQIGFER